MSTFLQDYLDRLHQAGNTEQLFETLGFAAATLGAPLFAYLALPTSVGAKPRLITNYPPAWRARYFARRYENSDPIVHRFQREPNPFYWSADDVGDDPFEKVFYREADDFGISYGYTVPMRFWHGRYAAVTFASDMRSAVARENIRRSSMGLESIATTFHLQVCATFETVYRIGNTSLTPREVQCLSWARSKTYAEIAEILNISARTVAAHIENAKRKLGVAKLHDAILIMTTAGKN